MPPIGYRLSCLCLPPRHLLLSPFLSCAAFPGSPSLLSAAPFWLCVVALFVCFWLSGTKELDGPRLSFFRLTLSRPQTGRVSVHLLIHFCLVPLLVCVVVFPPLSFRFACFCVVFLGVLFTLFDLSFLMFHLTCAALR